MLVATGTNDDAVQGAPRGGVKAMRSKLSMLVAGLLALGLAAPAMAGTSVFAGTLTLNLGTLPGVPIKGAGVATMNGGLGGTSITTVALPDDRNGVLPYNGGIRGAGQSNVTDPSSVIIKAVNVAVTVEAGDLAGAPALIGNGALSNKDLGLAGGLARVCLLSTACSAFLPLPLTHVGGTGLGIGGQQTIGGAGGSIRVSINHAPWTILTGKAIDQPDNPANGTITFNGAPEGTPNAGLYKFQTKMGFAHGPASVTGSTAFTSGVIQFVTPGQVTTNITATSSLRIANISTLQLRVVPEPGLLLLLGTGVAGLVVLGQRKLRK
jgi:hypothetical protein